MREPVVVESHLISVVGYRYALEGLPELPGIVKGVTVHLKVKRTRLLLSRSDSHWIGATEEME
jgi:hypothetical protein